MDLSFDFNDYYARIMHAFKKMQFGNKAQLAFLEDFSTLVNDGIPANRAIDMMANVSRGVNRDVALAISQKISQGQPLAEGMREWFNVNMVEIIRVGEAGGALPQTLKSAITTLSQRSGTMGALISAVSYPLLVIIIACVIIIYLETSVFDQFRAIKPMTEWPQAGRDLVAIAHLIMRWWWVAFLIIIAVVLISKRILTTYVGELRPTLDSFPPFSLYRRFVAARFMETLGLLVSNGVVFKQALRIMQYSATPYLTSHLVTMEHLLGMGRGNIADVLATGLIDEDDVMRLRIMGEVKGFEHGLIRMGVRGSEKSAATMKLIARIVGGILLTIAAILIITIVRGIYLTGMSMGNV